MTDRWRMFVAVPLGDGLRVDLGEALERWRAREDLAEVRWSDPTGWHVTLAFLGIRPAAEVGRIDGAIELATRGRTGMRLATGGLGAFPSVARARVAWYGVHDPNGRLAELAGAVRQAVDVVDVSPFRAHVTLGRSRGGSADLRRWVAEGDAPRGMLTVSAVELMRSHIGHGPARYERVSIHPLEVPSHA